MQTKISKTLEGLIARTAFDTSKQGETRWLKDRLLLEIVREEGSLAYQLLSARLKDWELYQVRLRIERDLQERTDGPAGNPEEFYVQFANELRKRYRTAPSVSTAHALHAIISDEQTIGAHVLEMYHITPAVVEDEIRRMSAADEPRAELHVRLLDYSEQGQRAVLLKGGRGGLGNWHFKSATNQAPRYAQPGEEGDEGAFVLELKVLADVGLVGFPNAGKSTLLSVVSAAKPKIANYAFTTLEPNLGIVECRDGKSFVMADIPGIIEGAHEGRGLGLRFLRHIERNSVLLFMVPADADDIRREYEILLGELTQYNPELLDKQRLLAVTKSDMLDEQLIAEMRTHLPEGIPALFISSVTGYNIPQLKDLLWEALHK